MLLALDGIKLVAAQSLTPGALFRIVEHHELGPLCMRAKFNDEQGYVLLDGDNCFRIKIVQAYVYAVPVDVHSLNIQLGATQPERTDEWQPGSLLVSESGIHATVYMNGIGGSNRTFRLNLRTGALNEDDSRQFACVANWRLIDRDEHGTETILCTAGDMG